MGEAKRRAALPTAAFEVLPCLHCTLWRAIRAHAGGRGIVIVNVIDAFAEVLGDLMRRAPSPEARRDAIAALGASLNKQVPGMKASLGPGVTGPRAGQVH